MIVSLREELKAIKSIPIPWSDLGLSLSTSGARGSVVG
jgi:hypothetical protein